MGFTRTRTGVVACTVILSQALSLGTALAVPSDREAWSNLEQKIVVYKDAVDPDIYWFIPKIRFETSAGKTVLRQSTLASGKVQYITRIIPYFTRSMRELVANNLSNVRQDSQLRPVVARSIGIDLPDFSYKFASPSVTNYQYLDVPRLVRFQLDPEEAATFDELYKDDLGVTVGFTVAYDGMMTDKFYNIEISCKEMARELSSNFKPSVGVGAKVKGVSVYAGVDLQFAFLNTVQNSVNGVNITSKGDLPGMQEMLRRVMNLCFDPVDSYGSTYDDDRYPTRRTPTDDDDGLPTRGDVIDDGFTPRNKLAMSGMTNRSSAAMALAVQEARLMKFLHDRLDLDRALVECDPKKDKDCDEEKDPPTTDPGLLPKAQLKMGYKFKKTVLDKDNQAVVKQVSMKDTTSTTTIFDMLTATAKPIEKVVVQPIAEKKFKVTVGNKAAAPLTTGIKIADGEQYTINAEFTFNAISSYSPWKSKQYEWDATWPKTDGDLYYRLGSGNWAPVNRRTIITSDVARGGGELQFYIDRSAIFNKIPEKLRKGNILVGPVFTVDGISPEYSIQVSGRRIEVK